MDSLLKQIKPTTQTRLRLGLKWSFLEFMTAFCMFGTLCGKNLLLAQVNKLVRLKTSKYHLPKTRHHQHKTPLRRMPPRNNQHNSEFVKFWTQFATLFMCNPFFGCGTSYATLQSFVRNPFFGYGTSSNPLFLPRLLPKTKLHKTKLPTTKILAKTLLRKILPNSKLPQLLFRKVLPKTNTQWYCGTEKPE